MHLVNGLEEIGARFHYQMVNVDVLVQHVCYLFLHRYFVLATHLFVFVLLNLNRSYFVDTLNFFDKEALVIVLTNQHTLQLLLTFIWRIGESLVTHLLLEGFVQRRLLFLCFGSFLLVLLFSLLPLHLSFQVNHRRVLIPKNHHSIASRPISDLVILLIVFDLLEVSVRLVFVNFVVVLRDHVNIVVLVLPLDDGLLGGVFLDVLHVLPVVERVHLYFVLLVGFPRLSLIHLELLVFFYEVFLPLDIFVDLVF